MSLPLQFVAVADRDGVVAIGRDDLVRYAGPSQIVASALCLRLFARAFADLSPDRPPERRAIRVLTAFPGEGVIDGIEMITRARTGGRLVIDPAAGPPEALPAPGGRFYFEVRIGDAGRGYSLSGGLFTAEFLAAVGAHQDGDGSADDLARYQSAKHDLIGRLLGWPADQVFRVKDLAP